MIADPTQGEHHATETHEVTDESVDAPPPVKAVQKQASTRTFLIIVGVITVVYVATFVRGLWWQWTGIILAQPAAAPMVSDAPRGAESRGGMPSGGAGAGQSPDPARKPLARTDTPAPRNTTDERGVSYDADGVAVMGIDADPSGVYNVPPGRQVRIGGPAGTLYDVGDGGKLTPAAKR